MTAEKFSIEGSFAELEAAFLKDLETSGGTQIETQTMTLEEL